MTGGANSSPFAAQSFPNSKKVPIYCWVDRESFLVVAWRSPASTSRFTVTLHHNRAALTTRPRRLSLIILGTLISLLQYCCVAILLHYHTNVQQHCQTAAALPYCYTAVLLNCNIILLDVLPYCYIVILLYNCWFKKWCSVVFLLL